MGSGVEKSGERVVWSILLVSEVVDAVCVGFGRVFVIAFAIVFALVIASKLETALAFEFARLLAALESCIIVNSPSFK